MRLRRRVWFVAAGILLVAAALPGCHGFVARAQTLAVTSSSLQGSRIPAEFTCSGAGISPQLAWSAPPKGTASFALIVSDPDAPGRTFVHWVLYDLPAATRALPEGLPSEGQLADGARQGRNDFGNLGYGGPCPPGHAPHHYVFTVYALDAKLGLAAGVTRAQVEAAMQGHILARGELVGVFQR
ncbi:MAG: YbhB/YbcL family Raf kinase inhibitor-like protein [Terracidiphilus sp.]